MGFLSFFGVAGEANIAAGLLVVVALAYAIGDYVSYKTKAMCSMIFVTSAVFLLSFWVGIIPTQIYSPTLGYTNIFGYTRLAPFFGFVMPFILVHMGTLMKIRNLINEWKTVTIAFVGIVGLTVGLYFIAGPIIGHTTTLVAAGPMAGGIVATMISQEAVQSMITYHGVTPEQATELGLTQMVVLAALILAVMNFFGLPVASYCLKKEGRRLLQQMHSGEGAAGGIVQLDPEIPAYRLFPETPKALQTTFVLMFKSFLVGYLAVWTSQTIHSVTGVLIHALVMCLVFGIIFYELGFLEADIFTKAKISGYAFFFALIPVWAGLTAATPQMVAELAFPILLCFGIALVSLAITSFILGKILGYTWEMAMAVSVTCMFGFPGTFILSNEVSQAITSNEEEKKYVLDRILPKMLIGGFTTVTIGSVILAGWLAPIISEFAGEIILNFTSNISPY